MRPSIPAAPSLPAALVALVAFLVLLVAAPAAIALESLAQARCVCADGALNTGDYVSCIAKFSRRLEAAGIIDSAERSDAVRSASADDVDAVAEECPDAFAGGDTGWGTSVSVSTPRPDVSPRFVTAIEVHAKVWNRTTCTICPDVALELPVQPDGTTCLFEVRVLKDGLVARRELRECDPLAATRLEIPRGTTIARDFLVPLTALDPDPALGLFDGAFVSGVLEIELEWTGEGPEIDGSPTGGGEQPLARIPIRTR